MIHFKNLFLVCLVISSFLTSCGGDDDPAPVDPRAANRQALGSSAEALLSANDFQTITVEFVYANNSKPAQETIDGIAGFLNERVNKPGGIIVKETLIESPNDSPYTLQEIRDIEDEFRTEYNEGDDIAVYVFFADGNSANDTDTAITLGTAYQNTSIVVYQNTLFAFAAQNPNIDLPTLENIVMRHEFGHLFALVNLANQDIHPTGHEDTVNNRHCVIEECLMYFQATNSTKSVLNTQINKMMQKGNVPVFDPLCIADLQAKGGI